jgi:hypothetical protein
MSEVWRWLIDLLRVGGPSVAVAYGLFKWTGQKWIEHRLGVDLERFKSEQQKDLERFKSEQQTELEKFRHLLSSRISKIHEKEFEVLPKAWLMLHELYGSVALALDLTFKTYPDFSKLSEKEFEEFLTVNPADGLSPSQKEAFRKAPDRQRYFSDVMASRYLDDAKEKNRLFHNYLIEHRIFMTDDLRSKFGAVDQSLSTAVSKYVHGPGWISSQTYDVNAKSEGERKLSYDELKPLLQDLLAQRFQLKVHTQMKEGSGYALVVAKGGAKLQETKGAADHSYILPNSLDMQSCSMAAFAGALSRPAGRPVVDETGLKGNYDIRLKYAEDRIRIRRCLRFSRRCRSSSDCS